MSLKTPKNLVCKTFEELFKFLLIEKKILSIALYRTNKKIEYVVTNPQKNTILEKTDLVYALGDPQVQYEGKNQKI